MNTDSRIGEINRNTKGHLMKIIKYTNCKNIDVIFEDGSISYNKRYSDFKKGNIKRPTDYVQIGEVSYTSKKEKMILINYNSYYDIDIKFEDGAIVRHKNYQCFKSGNIFKPNRILKNGNINDMPKNWVNSSELHKRVARLWRDMIRRCYDENDPKYKNYGGNGVTVCKEWMNLSGFWNDIQQLENYGHWKNGEDYQLDKDIRKHSNKVYSKDTCKFVTKHENARESAIRNNLGKTIVINRPIICLTTKHIFSSVAEAKRFYNVKEGSNTNIKKSCLNNKYSCGKFKGKKLYWKYLNINHNKSYKVLEGKI